MIDVSYSISEQLKKNIAAIEQLRHLILITPLSFPAEYKIRWEKNISRIHGSLNLSGIRVTDNEVIHVLSSTPRKSTRLEHDVICYKQALDTLLYEWRSSPEPVTVKAISNIYESATGRKIKRNLDDIATLLQYLTVHPEHPVILSGVALIRLLVKTPIPGDDGRGARLICLLFLYKYGFDLRGFLSLEEQWIADRGGYNDAVKQAAKSNQLTLWLEYYAQTVLLQLKKIEHTVRTTHFSVKAMKKYLDINQRQKNILGMLDMPGAVATNKMVQKRFDVSQITASRDLAKLESMGLVLSLGRGRSVRYARM